MIFEAGVGGADVCGACLGCKLWSCGCEERVYIAVKGITFIPFRMRGGGLGMMVAASLTPPLTSTALGIHHPQWGPIHTPPPRAVFIDPLPEATRVKPTSGWQVR